MEETRKQDVDMIYLLRRIKQAINRFFGGIGWLISFSLRHFLKISLFVILFAAIFVGLYYLKRPYFASTVTIGHTRVDNNYCKQLINNLSTFIDGQGNAPLARALGLSTSLASQVRFIEYEDVNENLARRLADSSNVLLPFKVKVEIFDKSILDSLQRGILYYLENNEYATFRKHLDSIALYKAELELRKEKIELDSLKQIVNQSIIPRGTGNGIIFGEPIDPVAIYRRSAELFDKQLTLERRQMLINSFEVIIDFNKSAIRADVSVIFYAFFGIVAGYLVGLFWLVPRQGNGAT